MFGGPLAMSGIIAVLKYTLFYEVPVEPRISVPCIFCPSRSHFHPLAVVRMFPVLNYLVFSILLSYHVTLIL